jgi:hypothetical protein
MGKAFVLVSLNDDWCSYAPFCKHIFVENWFATLPVGALPITSESESLLKSAYVARRENELAVLVSARSVQS